jgi:hypothetical protein
LPNKISAVTQPKKAEKTLSQVEACKLLRISSLESFVATTISIFLVSLLSESNGISLIALDSQ